MGHVSNGVDFEGIGNCGCAALVPWHLKSGLAACVRAAGQVPMALLTRCL